MSLFDQWPYTNIHELNLSWLLRKMIELNETVNNFVALNTIKYADPILWNITSQYEKNTVVVDPQTGTAYISSQPVPSGVALSNTDYWNVIFDLDIAQANNNITLRDDGNNVLATFTSSIGDWLLWNGTLYIVTRAINLNEAYVVGYNLTRYTVERFVKDYITILRNDIGILTNLTTTDKSNLVAAINEIDTIAVSNATNIGTLTDLTTTDKDNLVEAINEVDSIATSNAVNIGTLTNLTTTDKSNLVAAINEVNDKAVSTFDDIFAGKKVLILGDSLSVPNTTWVKPFTDLVVSLGGTVDNRSVAGYPIASVLSVVGTLTDSYDIAIIWCGVNDAYLNHPVGTTTSSGTFAYVYKDVMQGLYALNNDMIIYCIGISSYLAKYNDHNYSIMFYSAAIRACANLYGGVYKDILNLPQVAIYQNEGLQADGIHFKPAFSQTVVYDAMVAALSDLRSDPIDQTIRASIIELTPGTNVAFGAVAGFHMIGKGSVYQIPIVTSAAISSGSTILTFSDTIKPAAVTWASIVGSAATGTCMTSGANLNLYSPASLPAGTYVIQIAFDSPYSNHIIFTS